MLAASIPPVTDAELVDRARRGDQAAFGELVTRHQDAVFRAAYAVTGRVADAEDIAQETFVRAWQRLPGFRGEASARTWLLTIAWHAAISSRRSLAVRLRRLVPARDDQPFDPPAPARPHDARLEEVELASAVRRLVRALPEKLRVPLLLAATGDYTFDEMSRIVGVPAGTLKWRVSEARRRIREKLQRMGHGID